MRNVPDLSSKWSGRLLASEFCRRKYMRTAYATKTAAGRLRQRPAVWIGSDCPAAVSAEPTMASAEASSSQRRSVRSFAKNERGSVRIGTMMSAKYAGTKPSMWLPPQLPSARRADGERQRGARNLTEISAASHRRPRWEDGEYGA
eukprot:scaffold237028_cov30-Tisochrysis_lutea.AAC.2